MSRMLQLMKTTISQNRRDMPNEQAGSDLSLEAFAAIMVSLPIFCMQGGNVLNWPQSREVEARDYREALSRSSHLRI
jgi:hypothetical protein